MGANDADIMVSKKCVRLRDFVARHVAGCTIVLADFAGPRGGARLRWFVGVPAIQRAMAGKALYVVCICRVNKRLMWVMTGDAGDARVAGAAPAAAHFEAIRLEADGYYSDVSGHEHGDIGPCAVAGSAEVNGVGGRHGCGIGNGGCGHVVLTGGHGCDVPGTGTVAGFACDSWYSFFGLEATGDDGLCRVTTEATLSGLWFEGIA